MKTRPVVEEEKPYVSARKGCKEAWQKIPHLVHVNMIPI